MTRDAKILRAFEDELLRENETDLQTKFAHVTALLEEARSLGTSPPEDPLEGIERDIEYSRVMKSVRRTA